MWRRGKNRKKSIQSNKKETIPNDGFQNWGGYMEAKKAKLLNQFHNAPTEKLSEIFAGVKILVNGYTRPAADTLKDLMAQHGGEYHMYQSSSTTHIIASNLPNTKIKHLGVVPIVKPEWITESIALGKLLDYKRYLLYTNQSSKQPGLNFPVVSKPSTSTDSVCEEVSSEHCGSPIEEYSTKSEDRFDTSFKDNTTKDKEISSYNKLTKTASDPRFLEEFYNNSRLHLIATLGAEFKQLVGQMRDKSDGKFPGREKLKIQIENSTVTPPPPSLIMHIDMDCFFVSVGLRNHPELKGKPVAITHAKSGTITNNDPNRQAAREKEFELYMERLPEGFPSRVVDIKDHIDGLASMSEIASCSYEARKCGVKNGMFLGQAVKLCPGLKTLPYDFEGYKDVSNILYNTIASYTLDIEAVSCDEMYVDVKPILLDTGLSVEKWATHIRNEIMQSTGCPCSTGFGANRLQARLATKKAKPAGQYYLQSDDVESYMSEIALEDIPGVGRATLAKLRNLGLKNCGDVQLTSLKLLQSELGIKLGEKIRDQAFGKDNKPLDFHHERKSVSAEVNYGIRFKAKDECYNFLQSLSSEVFNRVSDINMRAKCLTLRLLVRAEGAPVETAKFLGHGVCDAISKSNTSNIVLNSPSVIFKEAKTLYDKLNIQFSELRGVGIQLTKLEKNGPINKALSNFLKQGTLKKINEQTNIVDNDNAEANNIVTGTVTENPNKIQNKTPEKLSDSINNKTKINIADHNRVRGRGRPKGGAKSNNSKAIVRQPSKQSSVIENFLGTNRNSEESSVSNNDQYEELKNHIDMNVFNELPEDIRKEIMKEYDFEPDKPQVKISKTSVDTVFKLEKVSKKRIKEESSPFSTLSWEEIKPIIKAWIKSENKPSEADIEMLGRHFRQLALNREIEVLKCVFNFLHRVFSNLDCCWHKAYYSLVNVMQAGVVEQYGVILLVQNEFKCCQIH